MDDTVNERLRAAQAYIIEAKVRADLKANANAKRALERAERAKAWQPSAPNTKTCGEELQQVFRYMWERTGLPLAAAPEFEPKHWAHLKRALTVYPPLRLYSAMTYMVKLWKERRQARDPLAPTYDVFFMRLGQWCSECVLATPNDGPDAPY